MPTGMADRLFKIFGICLTFLFLWLIPPCRAEMPKGFVDVKDVIPSIVLDIRYYSSHNFVGTAIDGYSAPKCLLTRKAALALKKVQAELLRFSLSLKIYDVSGRLVKTLVNQEQPPLQGGYTATWNGTNNAGGDVSSGVYFCRLATRDYVETRKMVLLQ